MSNKHFLDWIVKEKPSGDRIEAMQIQNGKNWIENAREMRIKEWNEMLDKMQGYPLWEAGAPGFVEEYGQRQPAVYVYPEQNTGKPRGAMIISAGGGYMFKSVWEAEPVARRFYEAGFQTFILDYRVLPYERELSAMDVIRAVRYVRYHAKKFNIRADKICTLGGSAGAMQSSLPATKFDYGNPLAEDPIERVSSRADATVLCYGTMPFAATYTQRGELYSFEKQNQKVDFAMEKSLRKDCPPFFIWQTTADDPRFICQFGKELGDWGIPFEMHLFPEGPHGCGLADGGHRFAPYCRSTVRWSQMAIEFLENLEFLD